MPVSSLPSNHGIGDFGENAYEFVRLIKKSGFKIWQILPLNAL
ncbi:MAG: 4-alpha-glucanotransferase, partial [Erysipelotrichales bacterium]|nr:4-alpha-glucanotransferase [Erysipelotrichales bacterium]MEA4821787.1 4-alpha-glucanotransferase [Erysipelotrichales bacterium]